MDGREAPVVAENAGDATLLLVEQDQLVDEAKLGRGGVPMPDHLDARNFAVHGDRTDRIVLWIVGEL
jgi:hypothetical protein